MKDNGAQSFQKPLDDAACLTLFRSSLRSPWVRLARTCLCLGMNAFLSALPTRRAISRVVLRLDPGKHEAQRAGEQEGCCASQSGFQKRRRCSAFGKNVEHLGIVHHEQNAFEVVVFGATQLLEKVKDCKCFKLVDVAGLFPAIAHQDLPGPQCCWIR